MQRMAVAVLGAVLAVGGVGWRTADAHRDVCADDRLTDDDGAAKLRMCCAAPSSCQRDAFWRKATEACCPDEPPPPPVCVLSDDDRLILVQQCAAICAEVNTCDPTLVCDPTLTCTAEGRCAEDQVTRIIAACTSPATLRLEERVTFEPGRVRCGPPQIVDGMRKQDCVAKRRARFWLTLGPAS